MRTVLMNLLSSQKIGLTLAGGRVGANEAFSLFHDRRIGARGLEEGIALTKRGESSYWPWQAGSHVAN